MCLWYCIDRARDQRSDWARMPSARPKWLLYNHVTYPFPPSSGDLTGKSRTSDQTGHACPLHDPSGCCTIMSHIHSPHQAGISPAKGVAHGRDRQRCRSSRLSHGHLTARPSRARCMPLSRAYTIVAALFQVTPACLGHVLTRFPDASLASRGTVLC
jgi:hypothetical protein